MLKHMLSGTALAVLLAATPVVAQQSTTVEEAPAAEATTAQGAETLDNQAAGAADATGSSETTTTTSGGGAGAGTGRVGVGAPSWFASRLRAWRRMPRTIAVTSRPTRASPMIAPPSTSPSVESSMKRDKNEATKRSPTTDPHPIRRDDCCAMRLSL